MQIANRFKDHSVLLLRRDRYDASVLTREQPQGLRLIIVVFLGKFAAENQLNCSFIVVAARGDAFCIIYHGYWVPSAVGGDSVKRKGVKRERCCV